MRLINSVIKYRHHNSLAGVVRPNTNNVDIVTRHSASNLASIVEVPLHAKEWVGRN